MLEKGSNNEFAQVYHTINKNNIDPALFAEVEKAI